MTQAARSSSVLERDQVEDGTAVGFDPPNAAGLPWAQRAAGSNPAAPTTFRVPGFHRGSNAQSARRFIPNVPSP